MPVTVNAVDSLYPYDGDIISLLGLSVLPVIGDPVSGVITDDDGILDSTGDTTVAIDGGPEQEMNYIGSGFASGLLDSRDIMAFSVGSGEDEQIYLYAPDGWPLLGGVAMGFDIDPTETFGILATTPGVVDGEETGESMAVGYTDADGDQITNYGGILGPTGNDTIFANGGNDTVQAGSGNDVVYGGTGDDSMFGQDGADLIFGQDGNDSISGGAGNDTVSGDDGDDLLVGGTGNDQLFGGAGADTIGGDDGNDTIEGGAGMTCWSAMQARMIYPAA